jgi:hypothetical protein
LPLVTITSISSIDKNKSLRKTSFFFSVWDGSVDINIFVDNVASICTLWLSFSILFTSFVG